MELDDYIREDIKEEVDEDCSIYLIEGVCPKYRHCSKGCPLYPYQDTCCVQKEA